jgi:hypothetical protein
MPNKELLVGRTKVKESTTLEKVMVLHNLRNSDHSLPHPRRRAGEAHDGITIPRRGYFPLDFEDDEVRVWARSYDLKRAIAAGILEVQWYEDLSDIPQPAPVPVHLRLSDPLDNQTVENILYLDNQGTVLDIIHIEPHSRATNEIDKPYLRTNHLRILRNARYKAEHDLEGVRREWLITQLDQRIKEIQEM